MILTSQSNEFLIIAIIGIIIICTGLLVYYIVTGRKKKEDVPSSNKNETNVQPVVQEPVVKEIVPEEPIIHEEPIVHEELPNVQTEAEKALEEEKTDTSIQTLLNQMQQDLDKTSSSSYEDSISRYEDEEEENAIISYTELMKYKENHDKDIVLEDKSKEEIKEVLKEEKPKEEVKKFKRSEFISPIFGYNDDSNVTYREIKRPPRKEKINHEIEWESDRMLKELEDDAAEVMEFEEKRPPEIDKNDKFLDELVDFRNKLN